jgi:hypothetical protein
MERKNKNWFSRNKKTLSWLVGAALLIPGPIKIAIAGYIGYRAVNSITRNIPDNPEVSLDYSTHSFANKVSRVYYK